MHRTRIFAIVLGVVAALAAASAFAQLREQSPNELPALEQPPSNQPGAAMPAPPDSESQSQTKEKLARVWANEPPLVRLARDKFGAELTESDAKFFAAVAANEWADLRSSNDSTFNPEKPTSWSKSHTLKADRLIWLCTNSAATKLVPSRGVWLYGAKIDGKVDLYRCDVPFSLTFHDCLFADGLNIGHAKLQELDIRNCCSTAIQARGVHIAENINLLTTCVYGGLDFIDSQIGGDFDFTGGLALNGTKAENTTEKGVALNLFDAKINGDLKLTEKFRAIGQVRLIGAQIGRSFNCGDGVFSGGGQIAIDARRVNIGSNAVFTSDFSAEGGLELCHAHIGGDLDCDGGRFIAAPDAYALDAEMATIGGQATLGSGFHAEGTVRLVNTTVGGDVGCNNGHFLNPGGEALCLDGATIGRNLRIGVDANAPVDKSKDLPAGFLARGTVRLWGTQISQDILGSGAQIRIAGKHRHLGMQHVVNSRVDLSSIKVQGLVNLSSADIEHELDLRCSQFDSKGAYSNIAIFANGMHVRGHVYCNQVETPEGMSKLCVTGLTSFQFATIAMHWDLSGAQFINPTGDAFDASDCRVGGYVNLDSVLIDGRASFSRAKIDGMWIINKSVEPQKLHLDMRFAHIWVIKDERLDDWPPAGQLQLEGLVYDHFDDDSPLDVNDRLAWLRRQYAPRVTRIDRKRGPSNARRTTPDVALHRTLYESPVRLQPTHAQRPDIIPTQFEAATMPAPQSAAPAPPMSAAPPNDRYHAEATAESSAAAEPSSPSSQKNDAPQTAASTATTPPAPDQTAAAEAPAVASKEKETAATTPAEAPDPAGRRYITQPYTQLASVYRAIGQDEQANAVLVARAERIGELAPPFSAQGLWYRYLGRLIGYGYEPFRAIKIGLVIIAVGAVIFTLGARRNLMAETKLAERVLSREDESGVVSSTYPHFNALVYSLDVFLPFVDLNQVCYWIPGERPSQPQKSRNCLMHIGRYSLKWSSVLHLYLWFQTLAGWTLCTLLAAAVTGIVQS